MGLVINISSIVSANMLLFLLACGRKSNQEETPTGILDTKDTANPTLDLSAVFGDTDIGNSLPFHIVENYCPPGNEGATDCSIVDLYNQSILDTFGYYFNQDSATLEEVFDGSRSIWVCYGPSSLYDVFHGDIGGLSYVEGYVLRFYFSQNADFQIGHDYGGYLSIAFYYGKLDEVPYRQFFVWAAGEDTSYETGVDGPFVSMTVTNPDDSTQTDNLQLHGGKTNIEGSETIQWGATYLLATDSGTAIVPATNTAFYMLLLNWINLIAESVASDNTRVCEPIQ